MSTFSALMIPFAFDLISTFVVGSTLPVATTDFTIVPTSAAATFEGSTSGAAPLSVAMPAAPPRAISATAMPTYKPVFDFLNRELMKACDEIGTP